KSNLGRTITTGTHGGRGSTNRGIIRRGGGSRGRGGGRAKRRGGIRGGGGEGRGRKGAG
ncbi:hypothetical protein SK128_018457, partial [Halocaridina rubra]